MKLTRWPGQWRTAEAGPLAVADSERGSFSLMLVILTIPLLALAGLVVDGGAKLNEAQNANAVAQEAARAGAGMVNQTNAYSTGNFTVDQDQAIAAAQAYLASVATQGFTGLVTPVGTESIRVKVSVTQPTRILSLIGIDTISSGGSATASLVTGVTGPGT
jgi:Flp pilus assembly protein TadG